MAKKHPKKRAKQKRLANVLICSPFVLTFATLLIYGLTDKMPLFLMALTSAAYFTLGISAAFVLPKKEWQNDLIGTNPSYQGKPISQKEALVFVYIFVAIILALGVLCAMIIFKELTF